MSDATQNWEYSTLKVVAKDWFLAGSLDQTLFESRLNQLGNDGWELVSVFDTSVVKDALAHIIHAYPMKRPARA